MDLALMAGSTIDEAVAVAVWADDGPLVAYARPDHYFTSRSEANAPDNLVLLAYLARATSRIRLSVMVSPITFRHPGVIAKMAATIDQMSAGRFELGIGTGWMEEEHRAYGLPFPERRERFTMMEDALQYVRAALGNPGTGYEGTHYRLAAVPIRPAPTGALPIVVGGVGSRRTPTLAGRYADELNLMGDIDDYPERIAVARQAAAAAGRDVGALRLSHTGLAFVERDDAAYRSRVTSFFTERGIDSDRALARLPGTSVSGSPARARETLDRLSEMGIERVYLQMLESVDLGRIDETVKALAE